MRGRQCRGSRPRAGRPGHLVRAWLAVALALFFGLSCATRDTAPSRPSESPDAAPDSLTRLDPAAAYRRALDLGASRQFVASLPYFRRALSQPIGAWQPYADCATTLFQATHESVVRGGREIPAVRSSDERVALLVDAARALDQADARAKTPREHATIAAMRARQLAVWGLTWEAVSEYARAGASDPSSLDRAAGLVRMIQDPLANGPSAE